MSLVRIGIVQSATVIGDVEHNFTHIESSIKKLAQEGAQIVVLPETWNTGFTTGPTLQELADKGGERTQALLRTLSKSEGVHIVGGSVAIQEDHSIYNRTYVYDRGGNLLSTYDKVHGFSPAKEDQFFQGGHRIHHFTLDGISCSSATCYDIRFPELIRKAALQGVELFFLPAQWPMLRLSHWRILNQARAIENQMYMCAVNGCGMIGKQPMAGHSMVINPWGEVVAELGEEEVLQMVHIDTSVVDEIRQKINVFRDRKPSVY